MIGWPVNRDLRDRRERRSRAAAEGLARGRIAGSGLICLPAFVSTLPLVVPMLLIDDPRIARPASHGVGIAMLFLLGPPPALSGFPMAAIGIVLAGSCVPLGG